MTTTESTEQRQANRKLAVDEAYNTLEEHKINRRRVVFVTNDERREGGYGVVRKAHLRASSYLPTWFPSRQNTQPQVVAVKEIKLSAMYDGAELKRAFTKEVLVWSRLKGHPGITTFLGFCADFDRREVWLISSWEPNGNVSEFIKGRELEVPEKLALAYDTIDALAFLHQLDPPVCHGDIKSGNVLVNSECRAVLCDFGLARLYEDSGFARLESTGAFKGSIRWCSPELLNGEPRNASSDIYAWAWLVWEIMTGELPYGEARADYVIMRKIFEGPVGQVNGESRLSECLQLWELMSRCWRAEPLQRPTGAICKTTFENLPHCPPTPRSADPQTRSAALLENLGGLESWKGNHATGFAYLEQALHLYEKEGNDKGIASVLRKQAAAAYRDSKLVECLKVATTALEKCRSLQDDIGVADSLFWMGFSEQNPEDAVRNLQESTEIFRANGNSAGLAKSVRLLGERYLQQHQHEKAQSAFEEAIDIASQCGDKLGEAEAFGALGTIHWHLNHLDRAVPAYQKACEIARSIGWEPGLSTCLCRLGDIRVEQGAYAEGEELLREAIRLARGSEAKWRLGQALLSLGRYLRGQGRHEEAISTLEEACPVFQSLALGFVGELGDAARLIADSESILGRKEEALAWYDRSIAEWNKGGYWGEVSKCTTVKDAILADIKRRDQGALQGETFS